MKIIYPNGTNNVAVIIPSPEFLKTHTIQDLARKDVPAGVPYLIVQDSDVPADRTYRDAWTADFSTPDGHGGDA